MKKVIKVYGERNTNTNYLSALIGLNLHAIEVPGTAPHIVMKVQEILPGNELVRDIYFRLTYGSNLGWKHTLVKPQEELMKYRLAGSDLIFITITKNPYSWLLSLYRNPYHQYFKEKPSFEAFLKREWETIGRDNVKGNLPNPIELWNVKNRSYLQLDIKKALNITTESMFQDAGEIVCRISERFSIERKSNEFIDYEHSTKDKSKDGAYYRDYYLSEKWRKDLSRDAIAIINDSIDKDLMAHFGYSILP
jgi:hypothetical protein